MGTLYEKDDPSFKTAEGTDEDISNLTSRFKKIGLQEERRNLPIFNFKKELLQSIQENDILIVVGETGSGKTTQLPQYRAEAGFLPPGRIGCTQPRRVSVTASAKRVAREMRCRIGREVGYRIRFENCSSSSTLVEYLTDGIMVRTAASDPDFSAYSCIILDEAHERSINTDVLMGLLKKASRSRTNLKLIVTSATLDSKKFSKYFNEAPVFSIPGRTYPVDIIYNPSLVADYVEACVKMVLKIHRDKDPGDILVFLTGWEEIDQAYYSLTSIPGIQQDLHVLTLYGAMNSDDQNEVFKPAPVGTRKVIFATNIAETSLTIDGVVYVIDPGFTKQMEHNTRTGIDCLLVTRISREQAQQRAGRAGRTAPGKAYRLYTESSFKYMPETQVPEIQRSNLNSVLLQLVASGIRDPVNFDFIDAPPRDALVKGMECLRTLGAVDEDGFLSEVGGKIVEFPVDPSLAKMLVTAADYSCSEEILTIVALLSVQSVFYRPMKKKQELANMCKEQLNHPMGDHLTLLNVYNTWIENRSSVAWCRQNFIRHEKLNEAQEIRGQLGMIMERLELNIVSCLGDVTRVQAAILAGFPQNIASRTRNKGRYITNTGSKEVFIHPSSALFKELPARVVYHEVVKTKRSYMREITTVD